MQNIATILLVTFLGVVQTSSFKIKASNVPVTHELTINYFDGDSVTINASNPLLPKRDVQQVCSHGVWMVYTDPYYVAMGNADLRGLPYFETTCTTHESDEWAVDWRSARAVGVLSDNKIPSATFFSQPDLRGDINVIVDEIPDISFPIASLITIDTHVEFFSEKNYQGLSFCFDIFEGWCVNEVCFIWSYRFGFPTPWNPIHAKSARIGCNPKIKE